MSKPDEIIDLTMLQPLEMLLVARKYLRSPVVIQLRPYERVTLVRISDEAVTIVMDTYLIRETRNRVQFIKSGKRALIYDRTVLWPEPTSMTMWDDELVTPDVSTSGNVKSPVESRDQSEYERDCYRPGSARFPLDNYDRVRSGPTTTSKMDRYW